MNQLAVHSRWKHLLVEFDTFVWCKIQGIQPGFDQRLQRSGTQEPFQSSQPIFVLLPVLRNQILQDLLGFTAG